MCAAYHLFILRQAVKLLLSSKELKKQARGCYSESPEASLLAQTLMWLFRTETPGESDCKSQQKAWTGVSKCNSNRHDSLSSVLSANWHTLSRETDLFSPALCRRLWEDQAVAVALCH